MLTPATQTRQLWEVSFGMHSFQSALMLSTLELPVVCRPDSTRQELWLFVDAAAAMYIYLLKCCSRNLSGEDIHKQDVKQ